MHIIRIQPAATTPQQQAVCDTCHWASLPYTAPQAVEAVAARHQLVTHLLNPATGATDRGT